jgi:serine/threonine protein phosphatase 1
LGTQRILAIGDIHGCSTALGRLIDAIDPGPDDLIVTLGDYIDWGPDSRGVIEQLIALSGRCRLVSLLGNHEEMLLEALDSNDQLRYWLKFGGDRTLLSSCFAHLSGFVSGSSRAASASENAGLLVSAAPKFRRTGSCTLEY